MGRKKGKKGRSAKRAQEVLGNKEPEELVKAPHTFVIYRGQLGKNAGQLMRDFKKVMKPFTASDLKVMKGNSVKDFVSVAAMMNVTHLVIFTKTKIGMYMKIARLPRGPTLTFQIQNYSLARDVLSTLRRRVTYAKQFEHHPLLVLNNFTGEGMQLKLMASMFQNMYPSINVNKVNLNTIRRCVLLNYDPEKETLDFRHYTIKVAPCGMSKAVKKLIQSKIPDLSHYRDVSEFIIKSGNLSESEAEADGPENQVTLPQNISSRGNVASQKSSIRLIELGPRMKLQLIKVEEGLMEGEVLFHKLVKKSQEEIKILRAAKERKRKIKEKRQKQQEQNKKRKEDIKNEHKEHSLAGIKRKQEMEKHFEKDEDKQWFIQEVGEEPDPGLFVSRKKRRLC